MRYTLPADLLARSFGVTLTPGLTMRGNFYKCGDRTEKAHYGMWRAYDRAVVPKPDFHRPELVCAAHAGIALRGRMRACAAKSAAGRIASVPAGWYTAGMGVPWEILSFHKRKDGRAAGLNGTRVPTGLCTQKGNMQGRRVLHENHCL